MRTMILASLWMLVSAWPVHAQVQSKDAQACINKLNQDGAATALQQGKESLACLTSAGKGKLAGTAAACLTADAKGKVAAKRQKTVDDEAAKCTTVPDFAYSGAATVNDTAVAGELGLVADLFGAPLDAAVIGCAADADGCRCQQQAAKSAQGLAAAQRTAFVKCTKDALQVRKLPFPDGAASAADVAACVGDAGIPSSIAGGGKGAIPRQSTKLADAIAKKCDAPGVTVAAFDDGLCAGKTATALAACIESLVACRVCETARDMDALPLDCAPLGCAAFHGSQTFTQTGVVHGFTVPAGVVRVRIRATGAEGGNYGGHGGVVTATIAVTPGEVLSVVVGGAGDWFGPGGANGGGEGGFRVGDSYLGIGGGGGGASDVRQGGGALENRVVVAAGGGGGMGGNLGIHGGDGGGLEGLPGIGTPAWVGSGGTQSAGGAGGAVLIAAGCAGQDGGLGLGGNGAFWIGQVSLCANYGGGAGGGGYYGGGGAGAATEGGGGGGGGGSSYATPAATDVVFGPATGEAGEVVISW